MSGLRNVLRASGLLPKRLSHSIELRLKVWADGGFAGDICDIPRAELDWASPKQMISVAALLAEVGRYTPAVEAVERALNRDPQALKRGCYAGLLAVLGAMRPDLAVGHRSEVEAAEKFRRAAGTFVRLVRENAHSIAVVGNSPSELGRRRGQEIDKRNLVIRFNSFSTDPQYRADVGSRVDVWCRDVNYRNMRRRDGEGFQVELVPIPIYWRMKNGQDTLVDALLRGAALEEVPQTLHAELRERLEAPPSSGLSILYWLRSILGSLDEVLVAGFSLTDQVDGPTHYSKVPRLRAMPPHDWTRERVLFDELVRA